jgi:hypothetical protein
MKIKKNTYIQILYLSIVLSFVTSILFLSSYDLSFAKQEKDKDKDEDDKNDKDKLVVKAKVNLENIDIENTKFLRVIGFINGEEAKQDIPISSIDKAKKNLNVELKVNEKNEIVEANTPDEFFVCAYQVGDVTKEYNFLTKFDCNEGDILGNPTEISVFKPTSQVYSKSQALYESSLNTINTNTNTNNNNNNNNSNSDTVKIKILAPLADKKDTEKLIIAAMIKGQIKSEVIEDVQAELDKGKGTTISRTFTFDRDIDIGKIQIGDRYHACVASDDLSPPEGQECEKRSVKSFDSVNSLPAR